MDVAFVLANAGEYAVEVFLRLLDIGAALAQQKFPGLAAVAGFVFVGNAERHDVEFVEVLLEAAFPAHVEHLQQALLGLVHAVFGPAFLLGYPDGRGAGGDGLAYVF